MIDHILSIESKDSKGLVYNISKILYEYKLNIEQNSEYVDEEHQIFFMRTVISGEFNINELMQKLKEVLPQNSKIKLRKDEKKDIVILATKETHCLGDLLIKYIDGELKANIKAVISNHNSLKSLVENFNIPYHYISADKISREEHEDKIMKQINEYNFNIIVLAKYMRILTPNFVSNYPKKMLNIHHSFLPAFIGANPYKQAHKRGVKIIGATAHYITNDLDEGPIISQDVVRIDHSYSWEDMRKAGRDVEKVVLSNALDLLLDDRVFVYNNKTVIL